jgi:hypothetical protein
MAGGFAMVRIDDVIASIKPRIRDEAQETKIRDLYKRTHSAFQTDRTLGIKRALDSDWQQLKVKFDKAMGKVKKDTGLF